MEISYTCPECEWEILYHVSPVIPGRLSGPPDQCYPDEGGEIDGPDKCPNCEIDIDFDDVYEFASLQDEEDFDDMDDDA